LSRITTTAMGPYQITDPRGPSGGDHS
jgi:hypothetical protein